jgi:hypothetical protein
MFAPMKTERLNLPDSPNQHRCSPPACSFDMGQVAIT